MPKRDLLKKVDNQIIQLAIRRSEWQFMNQIDFEEEIVKRLNDQGWSLEFVYLDRNENRFKLQVCESIDEKQETK